MEEQEDINAWMKDVVLNQALPEGKGIVKAIHPPVLKETKFGTRKVSQVVVEGSDGSVINIQVFLPQQFPLVHPKSRLAKILQQYGCNSLIELLGKQVEVEEVGDMIWKFK